MQTSIHRVILALFMIPCVLTPGCSTGGNPSSRAQTPAIDASRVAFLLDGVPVPFAAIQNQLAEISGDRVVEEAALGVLLERRSRELGIGVTNAMIETERARLVEQIRREDPSAEPQPGVIERIRANRGLGPRRFDELLRRNAILRAIVRRDPSTAQEAKTRGERAVALAQADTSRIRYAVLGSTQAAVAARDRLLNHGDAGLEWRFAEMCAQRSFHTSAPRGGLIPTLRDGDPTTPIAVHAAIRSMDPGTLSHVLETRDGPALVYLVSRSDGEAVDAATRERITRRAEIASEQLIMERLARSILDDASIIVTDPSLAWSHAR